MSGGFFRLGGHGLCMFMAHRALVNLNVIWFYLSGFLEDSSKVPIKKISFGTGWVPVWEDGKVLSAGGGGASQPGEHA